MTSFTVTGGNPAAQVTYTSSDSLAYGQAIANNISAAFAKGTLMNVNYTGTPVPAGTTAETFTTPTTGQVALPTSVMGIIDASTGTVNITGGAAGASVVAGSGGLFFNGITPSGMATANIAAGDGNNQITTSTSGGGNYVVNTGAGNDTIGVFTGNATVNAGTGSNVIQLGTGNSLVMSEGYDSIVGNLTVGGGGTDTVNVGSGQVTVNPGSSNFFIFDSVPNTNPLLVLQGTGSSSVFAGLGSSTVTGGLSGNNLLVAGLAAGGSTITGGGNGDNIFAVGGGSVNATAGSGNETLSGAGGTTALLAGYTAPGSTAANMFTAGTGNDLLIGGSGATTYNFRAGASGGTDTVTGFKATDTLSLSGYGLTTGAVQSLVSNAAGGSFSLSDGTKITLTGVTSLTATQIKTS